MNNNLVDFDVPQYIIEEITQYMKDCENGYCRHMRWENIKALIRIGYNE